MKYLVYVQYYDGSIDLITEFEDLSEAKDYVYNFNQVNSYHFAYYVECSE